jgi:2-aminoethylphosphonate dioxygenase
MPPHSDCLTGQIEVGYDSMKIWERAQSDIAACGWAWLQECLSAEYVFRLDTWSNELLCAPDGRLLKYYEITPQGRTCSRVERFIRSAPDLDFCMEGAPLLMTTVTLVLAEAPLLFKDKINYKPPGGGAYTLHQDAPAYAGFGISEFVTVMIPIDDTNDQNGCLEFAVGVRATRELTLDESGRISDSELQAFRFRHVPAKAGDLVVFDGLAPHRSAKNNTNHSRRAVFLTFNRASEGDRRDAYFQAKNEYFPPEENRSGGRDYHKTGRRFNLGNPFL